MRRSTADYEADGGHWIGNPERLRAVRSTGLLDAETDAGFDRLTALASKALRIPATFVSLLDENREFFISSFGMADAVSAGDSTPQREVFGKTMCSFVIQKAMPLVVEDVHKDPLLNQVALEHNSPVRAYLGIPLILDGHAIGGFCGLDFEPREWSDVEVELMRELALSALREIRLKMEEARTGVLARGLREETALRIEADENRERAMMDLARSNRELSNSNRNLDDFVYVASHDLKAPLRGVANLAAWIGDELGSHSNPKVREYISTMRERVFHLQDLIDGILEYSRVTRHHAVLETVDSQSLVSSVFEMVGAPSTAKIQIAADLPEIRCERVPLQQVLLNLIGNAVKHSHNEAIDISVSARKVGSFVEFSVSDRGRGIPREDLDRVFAIFQRVKAHTTSTGTGIGLAIVKKLVQSRGGRIWVDSKEGSGSTFYFTWPDGEQPLELNSAYDS